MGLVEYRRQKADNHPDNQYYQWSLGEAYVLNREYEKAIGFLSALHEKYADDPNIQHSLLDALFAIGKDETAIDWIIKPTVLRLNNEILDYCYNFLRTKRKPRTVYEVYLELYSEGYPMFGDDQLMALLYSDNRFTFTGDETRSYDCFVTVNRTQ
jgi:tetratricopeptide (TPR) repeat protein